MLHFLPRAPSAGCALVLLVALGPATSTPAASHPVAPTTPAQAVPDQPAVDSSPSATIMIPCISGTCQVTLRGEAAPVPLKPAPPAPADAPAPYALAAAGREP